MVGRNGSPLQLKHMEGFINLKEGNCRIQEGKFLRVPLKPVSNEDVSGGSYSMSQGL